MSFFICTKHFHCLFKTCQGNVSIWKLFHYLVSSVWNYQNWVLFQFCLTMLTIKYKVNSHWLNCTTCTPRTKLKLEHHVLLQTFYQWGKCSLMWQPTTGMMCIRVSTPHSKPPSSFFADPPSPLNLQTAQAPPPPSFSQFLHIYCFFVNLSSYLLLKKIQIYKHCIFHILLFS